MKSKLFFVISILMLAFAVSFVGFALYHPELSWNFSETATRVIYGCYIVGDIAFFILAIYFKKKGQ